MPKKFIATYLFIFITLLVMMSLSRQTSDKIRGRSIAFSAPLWETLSSFKLFQATPSSTSFAAKEDYQRLQLEKQLLEVELAHLQKQLQEQSLLASKIEQIAPLSHAKALVLAQNYQKSLEKMLKTVAWRLKAVPARVIFRSFDTWNHSLWINVGSAHEASLSTPIIALNSPVVVGSAIIGVIDYVGQHQSRVRLITDYRLTPSVRALRGGEQEALISEQVEHLMQQLRNKKGNFLSSEDYSHLLGLLKKLKENVEPLKKSWYLAKGVLLGSAFPSKVGTTIELKGSGFNYDFPDEEGSRDLRSGKSLQHPQKPAIPILKVNDVLVTTGMDGLFPPGFPVAIVKQIELLKEGDYFYDLKAQPIVSHLEDLSLVFVLPPISREPIQEKR